MAKKTATKQTTTTEEGDSFLSHMQGASLIETMLPDDVVDFDDDDKDDKGDADDDKQDDDQDDDDQDDDDQDDDDSSDDDDAADDDEDDEESDDDADETMFELERADGTKEDVTQQELLDGYLRQSDYTRKTQKLAEGRKDAEAVAAEAASARDQYAQQLVAVAEVLKKAQGVEPDWDKLRRDDPAEYSRQYTDWQIQQGNLKKVEDEQKRVSEETQAEYQRKLQAHMTDEAAKLRAAVPEFADAKKAKKLTEKLVAYGEESGFTQEELGQASDHRVLIMLNKARLYDELQAQKPKLKSKTKRAKSMKPGARKEPNARTKLRIKRAQKAAKRTGRPREAAAAIENLLPDDIF